jgi:hypothetical protein
MYFEKQQQYFDYKISYYQNIVLLHYLFIAILLVKITRVTQAVESFKVVYYVYN